MSTPAKLEALLARVQKNRERPRAALAASVLAPVAASARRPTQDFAPPASASSPGTAAAAPARPRPISTPLQAALEGELGRPAAPTPPTPSMRTDTTPTVPGRPAPRVDASPPARIEPARAEPAPVARPEPRPQPKIAPEPSIDVELPLPPAAVVEPAHRQAPAPVQSAPARNEPRTITAASPGAPSSPIVRTVSQPEPTTFGQVLARTLALRPR